jgi:hypothetical protein
VTKERLAGNLGHKHGTCVSSFEEDDKRTNKINKTSEERKLTEAANKK